MRQFSDTERVWVAKRHPSLVSAADREATVLWTWPQAPKGHVAHDPRPPVVGTHFLWDGDVVAEEAPLRLDGSVDWREATRWHYEPESFVPVARQEPGGTLLYIVTDHLGTPREMMDEAGRLRWAASLTTWGVVRNVIVSPESANDDGRQALYPRPRTSGNLALKLDDEGTPDEPSAVDDCPIRFQGQWADAETGLYYNRHRHYDPVAGQYASPDPIGLTGGERVQGYVCNPHLWIDPLGLSAKLPSYKNLFPEDPIPGGSGRKLINDEKKWRLKSANGIRTPDGNYSFVTRQNDAIVIARNLNHKGESAHLKLSRGADVRYAGEIRFKNGETTGWSNASGHYTPSADGAPFAGLPMDKSKPIGPVR